MYICYCNTFFFYLLIESRPTTNEPSVATKKYDALHIAGKKPLMRSYTTLDMRHKLLMAMPDRKSYPVHPLDVRYFNDLVF